jgi:regulatory protein
VRRSSETADPDDLDAAESTALRILGGASQSATGLERRLLQRGFSRRTASAAVERCRALGYIDDAALASSVVGRHRRAGHGRARMLADLRSRGVGSEAARDAVSAVAEDEQRSAIDAARRLLDREMRRGELDEKARRRIAGALQRRGFAGDVIVRALRAIG